MIDLRCGDCLQILPTLPSNSVDMILCDLPYGEVTACEWDHGLPLDLLWKEYHRICKGCIVLFASQPFTTTLIASNLSNFRYCWVWKKNFSTNFYHAKHMPLRNTEDICVFGRGKYYPQKSEGHIPTQSARGESTNGLYFGTNTRNSDGGETTRYPTTVLEFSVVDPKKRVHSTQKPVDLLSYLIRTYTDEGDIVLDNAMGSGSTLVACAETGRSGIGIEISPSFFDFAQQRVFKEGTR